MQTLEAITIDKVIDIDEFITIQNELSNFSNFSVVTVRPDGVPIGQWSNFTPFCKLIRSSPIGYEKCVECDRQHSLSALRKGNPMIYNCHCGLKDCAAPIVVNGIYIGSVLGGQVLIHESERKSLEVRKLSADFGLPADELRHVVNQMDVVSEEYLQRCINFYSFLAGYVAELSMKKITQDKLIEETNEKMRLQKLAKTQELKRIQAQVNPHFLFNALNSIARTAMLENADRTENLIYDLAEYLRYNIKNIDDFPKLERELDNLRHYLSIQKTRFADRIRCTIDFEPEILDWRVPSMTLQPIVENAIIHGLESKKEGGQIVVRGRKAPDRMELLISVYDNGMGVKQEIIDLFSAKKSEVSNRQTGLGLLNTHERIRQIYGPEYGIMIESVPMQYTTVHIKLPCRL